MRVLQLIDSLRPGGAEKMAVNIANALLPHVEGSYLCCTREEGMLKDELKQEVGYLFLNKRSSLDLKAILKLGKYLRKNKIEIVHAHSTSFFLAGLLKLSGSRFKLIWHDHYGESEYLVTRKYNVLKKFSRYFSGIISVNTTLKKWAIKNLECKNVIEIKNFIPEPDRDAVAPFKLKGDKKDFKIICVANLRPQKDHLNLLRAFEMLDRDLKVSLHLIGEDPGTEYSSSVISTIANSTVNHKIFYYGSQSEIISLLIQANLGVLSSRSEGLPLALIEYCLAGLPILCTDVGQCSEVVGEYGILVEKEDPDALYNGLLRSYFEVEEINKNKGDFSTKLNKRYSEKWFVKILLAFYNEVY